MTKALTIQEKVARAESATKKEQDIRRRNVFNGTEGKLRVDGEIPGYHLHIFNDYSGRIDQALAGGYDFVSPKEIDGVSVNVVSRNTDIGDKVRFLVGTSPEGGPLYAYLMKIKQEWWEEDQLNAQKRIDVVDNAIRGGKTPGVAQEGFYVPREGIKMT